MNARQARRVVQWTNGHYMIAADHVGLGDDQLAAMDEADVERLMAQQRAIGLELIRRSGIAIGTDPADLIAAALGPFDHDAVEGG